MVLQFSSQGKSSFFLTYYDVLFSVGRVIPGIIIKLTVGFVM